VTTPAHPPYSLEPNKKLDHQIHLHHYNQTKNCIATFTQPNKKLDCHIQQNMDRHIQQNMDALTVNQTHPSCNRRSDHSLPLLLVLPVAQLCFFTQLVIIVDYYYKLYMARYL
jgi:hypothetical protein